MPRDTPQMEHIREDLRIIDDSVFYQAQERRLKHKARVGRRKKGRRGEALPHLFEDILWCPTHKRTLWATGKNYICHDCRVSDSPDLYSLLKRSLAAKVICQKVAELILADTALVPQILAAFAKQVTTLQKPQLVSREALQRQRENLTAQINFIYECPAESDADRKEQKQKVAELQAKRAGIEQQLKGLYGPQRALERMPSEPEVQKRLQELADQLERASTSDDGQVISAAHKILKLVTRGRIELSQQGERKPQRGWLRATFTVDVLKVTGPENGTHDETAPLQVEVDIKEPEFDMELARKAKAYYDAGMLEKAIAAKIGRHRNYTRKLLLVAFAEAEEILPDGRSRRSTLEVKSLVTPLFQQKSEEVKALADQNIHLGEIATKLTLDPNIITSALRYWYESRGLPYLDGRTRRKTLNEPLPPTV